MTDPKLEKEIMLPEEKKRGGREYNFVDTKTIKVTNLDIKSP